MDYEALKEQWSEVEDRDGVRLSWNVFPSSRVVSPPPPSCASHSRLPTHTLAGSLSSRRTHRRPLYTPKGEARHTITSVRAYYLQTAMPLCAQSFLVSIPPWRYAILVSYFLALPSLLHSVG